MILPMKSDEAHGTLNQWSGECRVSEAKPNIHSTSTLVVAPECMKCALNAPQDTLRSLQVEEANEKMIDHLCSLSSQWEMSWRPLGG